MPAEDTLCGVGTLFVVATPLGNLDDLTARGIATLRSAALVACEDTRRSAGLLARIGAEVPTISLHKFNESERVERLLRALREEGDVALVSDGGTPGISDPGAHLVGEVRRAGFRVVPVPGPSAVTTLLSASGLPSDRFVFDGFLPHREGERRRRLRELRTERRTLVLYEAPHRLRETLRDLEEILGPRRIVLGRELTKLHETILEGTAEEIGSALGKGDVLGEVALAIAGWDGASDGDERASELAARWKLLLEEAAGDRRAALRRLARETGEKRAELQRRLAELGEV